MYTASHVCLDPMPNATSSFWMPPNKRNEDWVSDGDDEENDDDLDGDGRRKD